MNARGSRVPTNKYVRNPRRRKTALEVDLRAPASGNRDHEGTSSNPNSCDVQVGLQERALDPAPIDVDVLDDDVIISSPRTFAAAKNNSRRDRGSIVVVDVDSEERISRVAPNVRNKRRRVPSNQTIINSDLYINLEGNSNSVRVEPPPPPPPKEPTYICPVCMSPLVEETSTKCGHIFCKSCIKTAIATQSKCPTCRKKVNTRDLIRVYLPATN